MNSFNLNSEILFATDLKGFAIVNQKNGSHLFIQYPEAAVWAVLVERLEMEKSRQMLQAILGKSEADTGRYINRCLKKWKRLNLIQ
jgi:hypothetical protein